LIPSESILDNSGLSDCRIASLELAGSTPFTGTHHTWSVRANFRVETSRDVLDGVAGLFDFNQNSAHSAGGNVTIAV
jgi:hypothetical protein